MSQASVHRKTSRRRVHGLPAVVTVPTASEARQQVDGAYAMSQLLQIIGARREIVLYSLAACLLAATAYVALAPARYSSSATVLVDTPKIKLLRQDSVLADQPTDEYLVESQIQVLRSDDVARRVVTQLDLVNSSIRNDDSSFPFGKVRALLRSLSFTWGSRAPTTAEIDKVIETLKNNVRVRRVGLSRILEVTYTSVDPNRAADIANAFVDAYILDKRDLHENATQRSITWLKSQIEVVKQQLTEAERALEAFKTNGRAATAGEYRTRLKELESYAQSYRSVHDSLLPRYAEVVQQQGLPTNEARPVDRAQIPQGKSQPRTGLILGFALVFGLTLGIGLALLRDFLAGIRSSTDVETALGLKAWGALPRVEPLETMASANPEKRTIARLSGPTSLVLDRPSSADSEPLRAIVTGLSWPKAGASGQVLGVTSTLAGEGRATVSINLAQMMAASGSSVLLVDADRRGRGLSQLLAPGAKSGFIELLSGASPLKDALWHDPNTGLDFLPIADEWVDGQDPRHALSSSTLLATRLGHVLSTEIVGHYDYVVACLPPLEGTADAPLVADHMQSVLLVVEWQRTPPNLIRKAIVRDTRIEEKLSGAIINKMDPKYLSRIGDLTTVRSLASDAYQGLIARPVSFVLPAVKSLGVQLAAKRSAEAGPTPATKLLTAPAPLQTREPQPANGQPPAAAEDPAPALKVQPRRIASSVVGGVLKNTGVLSFNIARIQSERLLTSVYFHQPTARNFEQTMRWMLGRGYVPVSTAQVESSLNGGGELPPLALHVSLDDAWRSNLKDVIPIATALGLPVTIFVPTDPIVHGTYWWTCVERFAKDNGRTVANLKSASDKERRAILSKYLEAGNVPREAMTLDELKAVARLDNVTIGSHSVTHPILTNCSDEDVVREVTDSKAILQDWLGHEVSSFAYPNGSFGKREVEAVRKAGYKSAFTVQQRHGSPVSDDALMLPRFALTNDGPLDAELCRAVGVWPASALA